MREAYQSKIGLRILCVNLNPNFREARLLQQQQRHFYETLKSNELSTIVLIFCGNIWCYIDFLQLHCKPPIFYDFLYGDFVLVDLYSLYSLVLDQGGYDSCMANKSWKSVFDQLEGPVNSGNSAGASATHTRRHYERYVQNSSLNMQSNLYECNKYLT